MRVKVPQISLVDFESLNKIVDEMNRDITPNDYIMLIKDTGDLVDTVYHPVKETKVVYQIPEGKCLVKVIRVGVNPEIAIIDLLTKNSISYELVTINFL